MLTEYEARKLQGEMKHELNATTGVVLTCAVMLLLLVGIAWLGAANDSPAGSDSASLQHKQ